ncbi:hypothetical protein MRX96_055654 [Rhipicephalus microplus]|nr:uncharacterized protein LOC119160135 [Rhipicephalus microplus]
MRELVLVAALILCCALHLVTSATFGGDDDDTSESRDQWLQSTSDQEPDETNKYSLPWMGTPPSSGYYRWHDDLMRRSLRSTGGRYTAGELVEMLRRLAASRKLRQVRVANKAIRFGISKRSLRQRF